MTGLPLSQRAHAAALLMHREGGAGPVPRVEEFEHLDAARPATPAATGDATPPPPAPAPAWDTAAFDALPGDVRAAVAAGTARLTGHTAVEHEAARELLRPADVHLYLPDPARYVAADGRVDRDAIRRDLDQLVRERPEVSRYGHTSGQEPHRPDDRRRPAPDSPHGPGAGPAPTYNLDVVREQMRRGE